VRAAEQDERKGVALAAVPRRYVIDYSGPNVAKPLHVGHLRSTIIGDSLARLLRFLGHTVVGDNHLGDWGTQFGMLLYGYKHYRDDLALATDPVQEFARLYVLMRKMSRAADNPDDPGHAAAKVIADACRHETAKLHAGDAENVGIWQQFMPHCLEEIEAIYRRLDIHFDEMLGESFYNPLLPGVVEDLQHAGLAVESQGALVVTHGGADPNAEHVRLAIVRKGDGAFTYMTTDLATIRYRVNEWQPDALIYVVDARQKSHFELLFDVAQRWAYPDLEMRHIAFGSILGPDRKPLSTREGTATDLESLLNHAVAAGTEKYIEICQDRKARGEEVPELSAEEQAANAEVIGLGAVKYADLGQHRETDYVFDLKKMVSTEGNTATYMQYAYVRCQGIFRKGDVDVNALRTAPPLVTLVEPAERALAVQILRLEETLTTAAVEYLPHLLTAYLWDLAKVLTGFYRDCSVLQAATPELRASRLVLVDLAARIMRQVLHLIGIRTPERM
jgi:arginyl-tRNA synthetase